MEDIICFETLPRLAKIKIFQSLEGGALKRSREVCKSWNVFIENEIWNSKSSRRDIEKKIQENWTPPLRFSIFTDEFDVSMMGNGAMIAATGNYFALV